MFYKVFYTNRFVPTKHAACTRSCFVFIRPRYKGNKGLLAHELEHVKQWYRNPLFHSLKYKFSKSYRLQCELSAYRMQLNFTPLGLEGFAYYLANDYSLDLTYEQAKQLLQC